MNITITDPHIIIEHPENKGRAVTLICGPPGSGKTTIALQLHPKTLDLAENVLASADRVLALHVSQFSVASCLRRVL